MPILNLLEGKEKAVLRIIFMMMALVWVWALWPRPPALSITFLSVGQGDAIFLRTPSGRTALIDCGPGKNDNNSFDAGAKVVVPFLRRQGVNRLDSLILTHPHEDHIGGALSVIRNFDIGAYLDPAIVHPSGLYQSVLELVEERKINCRQVRRGDLLDFHDGVRIEVLNPGPDMSKTRDNRELNDASLVLRVRYGKVSILLCGDIGNMVEAEIMSNCGDISAQVIKIAHHGSDASTSTEWLAAVNPELAIISVGRINQFGHPGSKTLDRIRMLGIKLLRTDEDGGITVVSDGKTIRAVGQKTSR